MGVGELRGLGQLYHNGLFLHLSRAVSSNSFWFIVCQPGFDFFEVFSLATRIRSSRIALVAASLADI